MAPGQARRVSITASTELEVKDKADEYAGMVDEYNGKGMIEKLNAKLVKEEVNSAKLRETIALKEADARDLGRKVVAAEKELEARERKVAAAEKEVARERGRRAHVEQQLEWAMERLENLPALEADHARLLKHEASSLEELATMRAEVEQRRREAESATFELGVVLGERDEQLHVAEASAARALEADDLEVLARELRGKLNRAAQSKARMAEVNTMLKEKVALLERRCGELEGLRNADSHALMRKEARVQEMASVMDRERIKQFQKGKKNLAPLRTQSAVGFADTKPKAEALLDRSVSAGASRRREWREGRERGVAAGAGRPPLPAGSPEPGSRASPAGQPKIWGSELGSGSLARLPGSRLQRVNSAGEDSVAAGRDGGGGGNVTFSSAREGEGAEGLASGRLGGGEGSEAGAESPLPPSAGELAKQAKSQIARAWSGRAAAEGGAGGARAGSGRRGPGSLPGIPHGVRGGAGGVVAKPTTHRDVPPLRIESGRMRKVS